MAKIQILTHKLFGRCKYHSQNLHCLIVDMEVILPYLWGDNINNIIIIEIHCA